LTHTLAGFQTTGSVCGAVASAVKTAPRPILRPTGEQTPLSVSDSGEICEICEIWDDRYDRRRS